MRLHERFNSGATLSLDYRIYNLKQLAYLIKDNEKRIQECLKRDLDKGALDANMCDVSGLLVVVERWNHAVKLRKSKGRRIEFQVHPSSRPTRLL